MPIYYVNNTPQLSGDHEVHKAGCTWMPSDKTSLGEHVGCSTAVASAKKIYPKADGCKTCANACHTG